MHAQDAPACAPAMASCGETLVVGEYLCPGCSDLDFFCCTREALRAMLLQPGG